jgi:hypothetical protein
MSKFVGTGPSSYEKRIYQVVVSQRLRNTGIEDNLFFPFTLSIVPKSEVGRYVLTCYLNAAKKCNIRTDNKS